MIPHASIRRISQKVGLALTQLNCSDPEEWRKAADTFTEVAFLVGCMLVPAEPPKPEALRLVLDDPKAGA